MSVVQTVESDYKKFTATAVGHLVVAVATTFIAAGVSAVLKDASLSHVFAGGGVIATIVLLVRDILDPTVANTPNSVK